MKPLNPAPLHLNLLRLSALSLALGLSVSAHASIAGGAGADPDPNDMVSYKRGNKPELLLVIWDAKSGAQYTRDLGLWAAPILPSNEWTPSPRVNARDPFKNDADRYSGNLYITGQQNTGAQIFIRDFEKDPNFKAFQEVAAGGTLFWGITSFGITLNDRDSGDLFAYTTLRIDSSTGAGKINPDYEILKSLTKGSFVSTFGANKPEKWYEGLNQHYDKSGNAWSNAFNTHGENAATAADFGKNGSSFDVKGSPVNIGSKWEDGTAPVFSSGGFLAADVEAHRFNFLNPVGSSSWFYQITNPDGQDNWFEDDAKVVVDEFDNLNHDAYWGLTTDEKGEFVLSYTMPGVLTPTVTAAGLQRRSFIDFSAGSGRAQLITARAGEFAGWKPSLDGFTPHAPIAAVPEPASWGLMGLGLAALIGARRRARRSA